MLPGRNTDLHEIVAGVSVDHVADRGGDFDVPAGFVVYGNHGVEVRQGQNVIAKGKGAVVAAWLRRHGDIEVHANHDLLARLQGRDHRHRHGAVLQFVSRLHRRPVDGYAGDFTGAIGQVGKQTEIDLVQGHILGIGVAYFLTPFQFGQVVRQTEIDVVHAGAG